VISSLAKRLDKPPFSTLTLPLVCGTEIITCYYKGLLPEYVMLCYSFPNKRPRLLAKVSPTKGPSCTMWVRCFTKYEANLHSTEQDTLPIVFLISKQVIPYRTLGVTYCSVISTSKIRSLADSGSTCHDGINHLHHSNHYSNHNIYPHTVASHLDGWKTTTVSQRHKPNSTSQRMEDLYDTQNYKLSITNQV
jgi:hypothetical protein